ncbi:MAG: recombination mediator RecR [bacterium]|nr:recombination mediator RecR [bacterium]
MGKTFSPTIDEVVKRLSKLPGIGKKAAMRLAVHLLEQPDSEIQALAEAILQIKKKVSLCSVCGSWSEIDPCTICQSSTRDRSVICVVETPADVLAFENSGFKGLYHVLGGCLSPLDDIGPDQLRIKELLHRLQRETIQEVILAMNPTTEGETTAIYLYKVLETLQVRVTRIGFGIPIGSDVRLADEESLSQSLLGRKDMRSS